MNKTLLHIIIVSAIVVGGWYWYSNQERDTVTLYADVYPLYAGVSWGEPQRRVTTDGPALEVESVPFTDVTNIAEKAMPFEKYYDDKLIAAGWARDDSRAAGGPGSAIMYYTKGEQFVVVSFFTDFKVKHPDAPSECPCDVQFSLISGTQEGPTPAELQARHIYRDAALGFSVTLPTEIATAKSDLLYSVDTAYEYTAGGPGTAIRGVKFTIPTSIAAGTNLSSDSYVSVEHLPAGQKCDAAAFLVDASAKSRVMKEGVLEYSVASSTDAAVGNRYEETVYARAGSSPCIAVRYFIHYGAIENYPEGEVREFDKAALLQEFDQIRRTLAIGGVL